VPIPVNAQPFATIASKSGEFPSARYTEWLKARLRYLSRGPNADRFDASWDKVGVALVTACSKYDQHRCENVKCFCDFCVQNPSQALDLRIYAAGNNLESKSFEVVGTQHDNRC